MTTHTCLIGGFAALLLTIAASAEEPIERSVGQTFDDTALAVKATAALIENKDTRARNIDIEVYRGEVQLNGFVATLREKARAAATIRKLDGVKSVRNNLEVQPRHRSDGEVVDDSVITTKVKAALIIDARTKAYQIEVITNRGAVQLGGFVDSADAKRAAAEVASTISGVRTVTNVLAVKG